MANAVKIGIRSSCCNAQSWIIRVEQYERAQRTTPNKSKLDDPSFTQPIYARLFEDDGGDTHSLVWSRPTRRNGE